MTSTTSTVDPRAVGARAAEILDLVRCCEDYGPDCWATFTGYPIIARWDLARDAAALFEEGLRVLCLKAAVCELSGGDEAAAELVVSAPVDEMVHAILAHYTLCVRMTRRLGITLVGMSRRELADVVNMCWA